MDYREQNERAAYLYALYKLDGRDKPSHPMHGFYTGLFQNRQAELLRRDMIQVPGLLEVNERSNA